MSTWLSTLAAFEFDSSMLAIVAGVSVTVLIVIYFGVRFWLITTRPPAIQDVPTPTIDRMNLGALQHMAGETTEEDEKETEALQEEDAPADLKAAIPAEEISDKK